MEVAGVGQPKRGGEGGSSRQRLRSESGPARSPRAPYRSPHQKERQQRPPRPVRRGFATPTPPPFPPFSPSGPRGPYERRVSPPRASLLPPSSPRRGERGNRENMRREPASDGGSRRSPCRGNSRENRGNTPLSQGMAFRRSRGLQREAAGRPDTLSQVKQRFLSGIPVEAWTRF
jgi:hypothetical protein